MELSGHVDVVGVAAFPAHQHRVLATPYGLADAEFHGGKLIGVMYGHRTILLAAKFEVIGTAGTPRHLRAPFPQMRKRRLEISGMTRLPCRSCSPDPTASRRGLPRRATAGFHAENANGPCAS